MRKFIQLLAAIVIAAHLTACTSSEEPGEGDEAIAEESSEADLPADAGDVAENTESGELTESVDAPPAEDVATTEPSNGEAAPEGFLDEQLPEDSMGTADSGEAPPPEIAAEPPADSGAAPEGFSAPPPVDTPAEAPADVATTEPAPSEPSTDTTFTDTAPSESTDTASSSMSEPESAPAPKPLLKAETTPFRRGGQLLNAIYVSRPGDSFSSMARMIYGDESRAGDMKKANAWVNNLVPGTKIYYNSPQRPTDESKVLTYYEDAGIAPEIYAAQPGENLKTVSKNLLGYDGAWKEVWALNSVDSKGDLTEPVQLRYWKGGAGTVAAAPTPPVETAAPTPPPPPVEEPMMTPPPAEIPPPTMDPAANMAMNEPPPPPPTEEMAPPPPADLPPPPPPVEALNPPPPPPVAESAPEMMDQVASNNPFGLDNDTFMMLGGIGIVTLGLALLIIVRKRRQQRDMAAAFNDTQVG